MPRRAARCAALALSGIALLTASGCGVAENGRRRPRPPAVHQQVRDLPFAEGRREAPREIGPGSRRRLRPGPPRRHGLRHDRGCGQGPGREPAAEHWQPERLDAADLVSGEDLDDVASYVASVAGAPGIKGPQLPNDPGAPVFANNGCSGCHTLKAAGASGTTGPDLDQVIPGMSAAEVKKSIVDPNAQVTKGYPPGVMPQNFGQVISPQDLERAGQVPAQVRGQAGRQAGRKWRRPAGAIRWRSPRPRWPGPPPPRGRRPRG